MVLKVFPLWLMCMYIVRAEVATMYKDMLIEKHNELRIKQGASNMNALVWSDELANEADAWISLCRFEHENKGRGENLAFTTDTDEVANIDQSFENWYNEIKMYNYAGKRCGNSCHYTQLVWSSTREVGCAVKRCPSLSVFGGSVQNGWMIGCWYDPNGNDVSEYPYLKGAACSKCLEGQACKDGLCTGEGKEVCEDRDALCTSYLRSECDTNKAYMHKMCRQTCELCVGASGPCEDKNPNCPLWGTKTCEVNRAYMEPNCKKTCNFC